jgi:hypothetical protein
MREEHGEGESMNRTIKQRLTKCVIFLSAIIIVIFASGIIRSFIQAETAAARIERNTVYFGGAMDMGTAEVTQVSSNALYNALDFILTAITWLLIILFGYNGSFAAYKYFKVRRRKNEKD